MQPVIVLLVVGLLALVGYWLLQGGGGDQSPAAGDGAGAGTDAPKELKAFDEVPKVVVTEYLP